MSRMVRNFALLMLVVFWAGLSAAAEGVGASTTSPAAGEIPEHAPEHAPENEPGEVPEQAPGQASGQAGEEALPSLLDTLDHATDFEQTAALFALLASADLEDIERYILETRSIARESDRRASLQIIYLRYLDLDPEGAIDHMLSAATGVDNNLVYSLFFSWSKFELDRAVSQALRLHEAAHRQMAARAIILANKALDIDKLNELARRLGPVAVQEVARLEAEILGELAARDPEAALQQVLAKSSGNRQNLLHVVVRKWVEVDPDGLLKFALATTSPELRGLLRPAAFQMLAQKEPDRLLRMLDEEQLNRQERSTILNNAIQSIGRTEPFRALDVARSLKNSEDRNSALRSLVFSISYSDPDTAIDMLESLNDPRLIKETIPHVLQIVAQGDIEKALVLAERYRAQAPNLEIQLVRSMAHNDPARAISLASELANDNASIELRSGLIQSIAEADPVGAAVLAEDLPASHYKLQTMQQIARAWFNRDPDSAMAWTLTLEPRPQAEILQRMAHEVAGYDARFAMEMVAVLPSPMVQNAWITAIVYQLGNNDAAMEAVDWLDQFKDQPSYGQWMSNLVSAAAQRNPEDALDIVELIPDENDYRMALESLVNSWASRDVKAAGKWIATMDDLPNRGNMINMVAQQMAQEDVDAAMHWVSGFRNSAERDPAYAAIFGLGYLSTIQADTLMRRIMSPEVRFQALRTYVSQVARYDPQAAKRFLARQTLNVEQEAQLLEVIKGGQAPRIIH